MSARGHCDAFGDGAAGFVPAQGVAARLDGVLEYLGIGCPPFSTAEQALRMKGVIPVLPNWDYVTSYHGMAWILYQPNRYLPPKCRVLIDYLAQKICDQDAGAY